MSRVKKILVGSLVVIALGIIIKPCGGPGGVTPIIDTIIYTVK